LYEVGIVKLFFTVELQIKYSIIVIPHTPNHILTIILKRKLIHKEPNLGIQVPHKVYLFSNFLQKIELSSMNIQWYASTAYKPNILE
jgi:hypothetical protein